MSDERRWAEQDVCAAEGATQKFIISRHPCLGSSGRGASGRCCICFTLPALISKTGMR